MEKPKNKPKHKPEQTLMEALDFTEADLEANQAGKMSVAQQANLRRQNCTITNMVIFLFGLAAAVWLFMGLFGIESCIGGLIVSGALAAIAVATATRLGSRNQDIKIAKVASVEGRVQLDTVSLNSAQQFTVSVQDKKFTVKKTIFLAFKNGDPYVIYYAPASKTIVAVEWLREDSVMEKPKNSLELSDSSEN